LWPAAPLAALVTLHGDAGFGWHFDAPILLAVIPLWVGDSLAIFIGRAFGKHAVAPKISPNKTWEGTIANLAGCIVAAFAIGWSIRLSWPIATACGLAAGTLGQIGDLFESAVKRIAGAKDSGGILPGHGGLMDRVDSLLFTAPAVALILVSAPKANG
jgi:phosphatidate cytidylyltransferase